MPEALQSARETVAEIEAARESITEIQKTAREAMSTSQLTCMDCGTDLETERERDTHVCENCRGDER